MAVATSTNYFSNAIVGQPMVGADIDIYRVDLTPKYQIGFGFTRADGNKFRYCQNGAGTLTPGLVVSPDISNTDSTTPVIHKGAAVANITRPSGETFDPNAIGSHYVQCSITAVHNQFAGGYLVVSTGTGLGFTYRVRGNTATDSPKAGEAYIELYEPIQVAVDSNSGFTVVGNKYIDLIVADQDDDNMVTGVSTSHVSTTNCCWIGTRGTFAVLQDANVSALPGSEAFLSSTTDGAVEGKASLATIDSDAHFTVRQAVGFYRTIQSNASYSTVYINLE